MIKQIYIILLFVGVANLQAELPSSIKWLMNEPASLFDIGMIQLRLQNQNQWTPALLKKIDKSDLTLRDIGFGNVVYNEYAHSITVGAYFVGKPDEKTCSILLEQYKDIIIPKKRNDTTYEIMAGRFSHINYKSPQRPKALNKDLSELFVYQIGISETNEFGSKSIFCRSKVDEDNVSCTRYGFK